VGSHISRSQKTVSQGKSKARLVKSENAAHRMQSNEPKVFNEIVLTFLKEKINE
jgi:pimeloyl-ACP methyl ester carboxylesterase